MIKKLDSFGSRLRAARERAGLTLREVGNVAGGIKPQSIAQWETGATRPSSQRLAKVAALLGVSVDWLMYGRGDFQADDAPITHAAHDGRRLVPQIDITQATTPDAASTADALVHVASQFPCGPRAFSVRVNDRSNSPLYRHGDAVVIDPDVPPVPGDMVLAVYRGEPVIRQYRIVAPVNGGDQVVALTPHNELWPAITSSIGDDLVIVGVITEHTAPRRT